MSAEPGDGPGPGPERWRPLLDDLALPPALVDELVARYAEPARAYHGVEHIAALARLYLEVAAGPGWRAPAEVQLAILFHDVVYEPGASDNETCSAALARERLAPLALPIALDRVASMIEATRDHGGPETSAAARHDHDLAHFLDADMAILGAAPEVYARYAADVRREFAAVPEPLYRHGRAQFLRAQLERARLFHSAWFEARYAAQARANLEAELGASA